jgi:hypothetical protein
MKVAQLLQSIPHSTQRPRKHLASLPSRCRPEGLWSKERVAPRPSPTTGHLSLMFSVASLERKPDFGARSVLLAVKLR